jgi:glutamine synthetase
MLSLESLTALVDAGEIDTVLAAVVDADGNLVGHRLHGRHFLDSAYREIRCSLRILTPDVPGNGSAHPGGTVDPAGGGADAGRPCTLRPDLATLRRAAWLPSSALVLCDVLDQQGHAPIHHSPRQMLIHQIARAANLGYEVRASTELQYRVFQNCYESTQQSGCIDPIPLGSHLSGFELHAPLARERLSGRLRRDLSASGLPVAGTIVSNEPGWERLILQHAGGLAAAGHHGIATLAARDIGEQLGTGVGFRAKRDPLNIGSSSRIQMSLWSGQDPLFFDDTADLSMSTIMRCFMGGLIKGLDEITYFLVPDVGSYERFHGGFRAPTRKVWSLADPTAALRPFANGTRSVQVECRLASADANPYLAIAAMIAAGLDGVSQRLDCGPQALGGAYAGHGARVPASLREATFALGGSAMLRKAMGDAVIDHYVHFAEQKQAAVDRATPG